MSILIIYICSECLLENKIWNAQSSIVHVTGYERLKEYTYVEIKIHHPPRIHDTKYNKINKSIHHERYKHLLKDITIHQMIQDRMKGYANKEAPATVTTDRSQW